MIDPIDELIAALRRNEPLSPSWRGRFASGGDPAAALRRAWDAAEDAQALLRLSGRAGDTRACVAAACACVRTALHLAPAGEDRPRRAVEVAECWSRGEPVSATDVEGARVAARAAEHAAAACRKAVPAPEGPADLARVLSREATIAHAPEALARAAQGALGAVQRALQQAELSAPGVAHRRSRLIGHAAAHAAFHAAMATAYGTGADVSAPEENPRGWVFAHRAALAALADVVRSVAPCPDTAALGFSREILEGRGGEPES